MVYWTEHEEQVDRIEKYAEIFKNDDGVSTFSLVPSFYMLLYLTRLYNTAAAAAADDDDVDDDDDNDDDDEEEEDEEEEDEDDDDHE